MNFTKFIGVLAVSGICAFGISAQADDLTGNWKVKDGCIDQGDGTSLSLSAEFKTDTTFSIMVDIFSDATCTTAADQQVVSGKYKIGGASAAIKGAVELDLDVTGQSVLYTIYFYDPTSGVMQIGTSGVGTDDGSTAAKRHQALLGEPFVFVRL